MKALFAPWRKNYITGLKKKAEPNNNRCVFCFSNDDKNEDQLILGRYKNCNIIMNLYPYSAGHVMIIPSRHVANLTDLTHEELNELMFLTKECSRILQSNLNAEGINLGMNLGKASGAGIPEHIHMHVLPRWLGDTGFLCSTANTKVISINLNELYLELKPEFEKIKTINK